MNNVPENIYDTLSALYITADHMLLALHHEQEYNVYDIGEEEDPISDAVTHSVYFNEKRFLFVFYVTRSGRVYCRYQTEIEHASVLPKNKDTAYFDYGYSESLEVDKEEGISIHRVISLRSYVYKCCSCSFAYKYSNFVVFIDKEDRAYALKLQKGKGSEFSFYLKKTPMYIAFCENPTKTYMIDSSGSDTENSKSFFIKIRHLEYTHQNITPTFEKAGKYKRHLLYGNSRFSVSAETSKKIVLLAQARTMPGGADGAVLYEDDTFYTYTATKRTNALDGNGKSFFEEANLVKNEFLSSLGWRIRHVGIMEVRYCVILDNGDMYIGSFGDQNVHLLKGLKFLVPAPPSYRRWKDVHRWLFIGHRDEGSVLSELPSEIVRFVITLFEISYGPIRAL
jgi:hypothetical protein